MGEWVLLWICKLRNRKMQLQLKILALLESTLNCPDLEIQLLCLNKRQSGSYLRWRRQKSDDWYSCIMNCLQIRDVCWQFLSQRGRSFVLKGWFLFDQLPTRVKKFNEFSFVYIFTTRHPPSQMGHYVLVLVTQTRVIYFDSYGIAPHHYSLHLQKFINSH